MHSAAWQIQSFVLEEMEEAECVLDTAWSEDSEEAN